FIDDISGSGFIRRFCVSQLPVDVKHRFFFRVTGVFLQCIVKGKPVAATSISFFNACIAAF
ncbi:MAG: hypothetical protein R6V58_16060, partial [Planctomycetota bacterium]